MEGHITWAATLVAMTSDERPGEATLCPHEA